VLFAKIDLTARIDSLHVQWTTFELQSDGILEPWTPVHGWQKNEYESRSDGINPNAWHSVFDDFGADSGYRTPGKSVDTRGKIGQDEWCVFGTQNENSNLFNVVTL
jgi:hypothetical protein